VLGDLQPLLDDVHPRVWGHASQHCCYDNQGDLVEVIDGRPQGGGIGSVFGSSDVIQTLRWLHLQEQALKQGGKEEGKGEVSGFHRILRHGKVTRNVVEMTS